MLLILGNFVVLQIATEKLHQGPALPGRRIPQQI
jgi:hypothetical protein